MTEKFKKNRTQSMVWMVIAGYWRRIIATDLGEEISNIESSLISKSVDHRSELLSRNILLLVSQNCGEVFNLDYISQNMVGVSRTNVQKCQEVNVQLLKNDSLLRFSYPSSIKCHTTFQGMTTISNVTLNCCADKSMYKKIL